jgi:hypothetical protein
MPEFILDKPRQQNGRVVSFPAKGQFRRTYVHGQAAAIIETHMLAALLTIEPTIDYEPVVGGDGKVHFAVHDPCSEAFARLNADEPASILAYMDNLNKLRDIIFAIKKGKYNSRVVV